MNARGESLTLPPQETVEVLIAQRSDWHRRQRFTSNIAGPIFFLADLACVILSVPVALEIYRLLISNQTILPVHLFAVCAAAGTYLLIRMSRHAYDRTLVNSFESDADSLIDAVASVLIASALVWQFGMIENLSRGIDDPVSDCFLRCCCSCPDRSFGHCSGTLPAADRSSNASSFYGADPVSLGDHPSRSLDGIDLPHLRFWALPTTARRSKRSRG